MASFWKLIGGDGQQSGDQVSTDVQTIERLCDRVHSSTLLEDRRDAVRALKSLSRKFRLEVGSRAFDILIPVLENDRSDAEITGYALETMCNVMSNEPLDGEEENPNIPEDLGSQFTDIFIQTVENVSLLLSFLEEYDFHVRWPAVRLITVLLSNQGRDMQEIVLSNPMGISKLMDLLVDSREIIRNDGLLLLIQLTKGNTNIQKIVAFENGFERLLEIIHEEGNSDGGIVVEDCLLLLLNLLKTNTSNQNFFKEGSFIPRLPPYFELQPADQNAQNNWSAQKVSNIHLMLQLVRTLVSPNNPQQQTASCQKAVNQCGLLEKLCTILMASGVPADVLTETINTVSEIIRGNQGNQEYFASVMAPSNPPRPAIVVLLMSMVNEKQPFVLRCAVLYCFQSFLYKNELGQSQIIQTLLPTTAEVNAISAGQLLCGGLFSTDPLSTWFAAVALQHAIVDNNTQKEQLLRVQLATSIGNPPVSLLQQCTNILAQGGKVQTRVGLLMLLCHWLAHCPIAVTHFLHNTANVPFLISQVSSSEGDELELVVQGICAFLLGICVLFNNDQVENCQKNDLRQMIEKRIGLENFTDKLSQVSKHESYSKAAKKPQINYKLSSEVLFDYIFTRLFKTLENEVLKALSPVQEDEAEVGKKQAMLDQHESIVQQYKKLIREQDEQLNQLRADLKNNSDKDKTVEDMQQQIQQLKDQNALLKAQRGAGGANASGDLNVLTRLQQEMEDMTKQVQEKNQQIETLKGEKTAAEAKALLGSQIEDKPSVSEADAAALQANITRLSTDIDGLRKKLSQKEEEVKLYKNKYEDSSKQVAELREQVVSGSSQDSANSALVTERNSLISRITELENTIQTLERENKVTKDSKTELEQKIESICQDNSTLQDKIKKLEAEKTKAEDFKKETVEELDGVKKEQEDLLVLLADQDTKLADYKNRLKELGQQVDEDEDEDDLDDFEDEDEVDPDED